VPERLYHHHDDHNKNHEVIMSSTFDQAVSHYGRDMGLGYQQIQRAREILRATGQSPQESCAAARAEALRSQEETMLAYDRPLGRYGFTGSGEMTEAQAAEVLQYQRQHPGTSYRKAVLEVLEVDDPDLK
jgi:hypothetical protein